MLHVTTYTFDTFPSENHAGSGGWCGCVPELTSAAFNLVIRVLALLDVLVLTELLPPRLRQETHRQKNLPTINFPPRASPRPAQPRTLFPSCSDGFQEFDLNNFKKEIELRCRGNYLGDVAVFINHFAPGWRLGVSEQLIFRTTCLVKMIDDLTLGLELAVGGVVLDEAGPGALLLHALRLAAAPVLLLLVVAGQLRLLITRERICCSKYFY